MSEISNLLKIQKIRQKALAIVWSHEKIMVAVSGGSDSDIITHIIVDALNVLDQMHKAEFVFFDTGLDYEASISHLRDMESKYGISILEKKPKISAASAIINKGQPFISKHITEMISRLQKHNFDWSDRPLGDLFLDYPNCKSALRWWKNANGKGSAFNIEKSKLLKEFMIQNQPWFKVSNDCCKKAKKDLAKEHLKTGSFDLNIMGIRRSEQGARSVAYKSCFSESDAVDLFMPIFYMDDELKRFYKEFYGINYSDCYEVYGLTRTGCVGCPFSSRRDFELDVCERHEPKTHKAISVLFKDSYEYRRLYEEFKVNYKDGR